MEMDLNNPTQLEPERIKAVIAALEAEAAEDRLSSYKPTPKQLEFHRAGADHRERLLCAGNQTGKTTAAAMELAMHCTGLYPDWWCGRHFDRPINAWACGESSEMVRSAVQRLLLGDAGSYGTGAIPKSALLDIVPSRGLAELADIIRIRHAAGGTSTIGLKSYGQGRERFQGATIDFLWLDEEPDENIFVEALTRTNATLGPSIMTFTPIKGMSSVVKRYLLEPSPDRAVITMTLADAEFYSAATRAAISDQYPEHERDARIFGIPAMGEGRVFPVDLEKIVVDPFAIPSHWAQIGGVDFGWDHPSAWCHLAWDRDRDIVYLIRTLRLRRLTPHEHVEKIREAGLHNLCWAWPADGKRQTLEGAGLPLMKQYENCGLDMLFEHATWDDGTSTSVEAGVAQMLDRMKGGRWKVFRGQNAAWLEEARLYHRKDGLLVKEGDDAISASRYALMMLRHARASTWRSDFHGEIRYPKRGIV
jgi:phage terminase large subunit-like protein